MDPDSFLIILVSLFCSAFFSGMEIAFVASNKLHLELMKKRGEFNARILSPFLESPSRFIATMLVGNNIALVVYVIEMARVLEPMIKFHTDSAVLVLTVQTILSTAIVLVTAEFIPKVLFSLNANRFIRFFALPAWLCYYSLYVIVSLVVGISNAILKYVMRVPQMEEKLVFERLDLEQYLDEHDSSKSKQGEEETEIQIFKNALDFSKVKARECMIPRNEIVAMELSEDIEVLRDKFVQTGFSKIVIYKENIDHIIGYTHSYELFKEPNEIKSILLPIAMLPETMTANEILNLFLKERKSIALVVDEFGGTSGLVTVEDVVEEIFGEIQDEHDSEALLERRVSEDEFVFSGRHEIDYLNEKYALKLPQSDDYETLSGLIVHYREDIPQPKESIKMGGFSFFILDVDQTRIEKVKLFLER